MRLHLDEPFPDSIEKGADYGEVAPVMIGADILGWATRASQLSWPERSSLEQARAELARSIAFMPSEAQPYYERLVRIAELALAR